MGKINLLYGFLIGLAASFSGSFLFISLFTPYGYLDGIHKLSADGLLGKVITLGTIMNLIAFFVLLKYKQELMARGVLFATIFLTVVTLLV